VNLKKPQHLILKLALPVVLDQLFDYFAPKNSSLETLQVGMRVVVSFAGTEKIGWVLEIISESLVNTPKLKTVLKILDYQPLLNAHDSQLRCWLSSYYHYPIGKVFCNNLPTLLKKGQAAILNKAVYYTLTTTGQAITLASLNHAPNQQFFIQKLQQFKTVELKTFQSWHQSWKTVKTSFLKKKWIIKEANYSAPLSTNNLLNEAELNLNKAQQQALNSLNQALGQFKVFLLDGVTGSGKTEVYLQIITKVLARSQQVMVLLPEITLTPQLEARFRQRFSVTLVIYHSRLTDKQRLQAWLAMQTGAAAILLGTRSALLTPVNNMGLLILDEEHDSSFKQQNNLRFSTRDVAIMRAKLLTIPVLLGSATPSLESLANVARQRYHSLRLPQRAGNAKKPKLELLDVRNQRMQYGLSAPLLKQISQTLSRQQQVLIFLNRRGFAPRLMCHSCGWVACCHHCSAYLVIHQQTNELRCHHCQHRYLFIQICPACQKNKLQALGLGTERIEQGLNALYPDKNIVRLDADTTQTKGSLEKYLTQINQGEANIILGTQMLAKGHHFPNVTLAVLLDIDSGLFSIDFRATEKLAQLIIQVAGRAGRGDTAGKVILQTKQPQHPLLLSLIQHGYAHFAKAALQERQAALLPPYSYQALLRVSAIDEKKSHAFFQQLNPLIEHYNLGLILILGPVMAPMARREGRHCFQLLFQSEQRMALHAFLTKLVPEIFKLKQAKKVQWSVDVDPINLY
jgi:primosomal protein N' (replication factor Y)